MLRIALAVIVGFIVWSVIWTGTDVILTALFPIGYGKYITDLQTAAATGEPFETKTYMSLCALALSIICSLVAGYITVLIARENKKSPLILGFILLVVGLLVQISFWIYFPLWYHLTFLILLIPVTMLGGKLRKV